MRGEVGYSGATMGLWRRTDGSFLAEEDAARPLPGADQHPCLAGIQYRRIVTYDASEQPVGFLEPELVWAKDEVKISFHRIRDGQLERVSLRRRAKDSPPVDLDRKEEPVAKVRPAGDEAADRIGPGPRKASY